jgi:hypothetical protein
MDVFVFTSSNAPLGKFEILTFDDLSDEFQKFTEHHKVMPNDYIECLGQTWTLVENECGSFLKEGRISPGFSAGRQNFPKSSSPKLYGTRYRDAYLSARALTVVGSIIKGVGILLGVLILFLSVQRWPAFEDFRGYVILGGIVISAVVAAPIYVSGILISALGQITLATLDSSVYSSPFLSLAEKANITSIQYTSEAEQ